MANPKQYCEDTVTGQLLGNDVETVHALDGEILQQRQALYDRLCFPIDKIPERYVRQNLSVVVKVLLQRGGVQRRIAARIVHIPHNLRPGNLEPSYARHDDKFPVFVHHVELMDYPKKGIFRDVSMVGLQSLDQIPDAGVGDSLYLSFVTGKHVRLRGPLFENWELDKLRFFAGSMRGTGKQPDDVIETRPVVMNNLSGQNGKTRRNGEMSVVLNLLQEKLSVVLAENWVFAFLKEPLNFRLQIEDTLFGPLDLF